MHTFFIVGFPEGTEKSLPDTILDVDKWVDKLLYDYRVFITPGFVFGEKGKRYIRVSLCSDVQMFQEALDRLKDYKLESWMSV